MYVYLFYNVEGSNLEVNSDGRKEAIIEDIIGESQQKWWFSYSWITDEQKLEEVVVVLL